MHKNVTFLQRPLDSVRRTADLGLPLDLLEKSRRRVKAIALLVLIACCADLISMTIGLLVHVPEGGVPGSTILALVADGLSVTLSIILFGMAMNRNVESARLINTALLFEVFLAFMISGTNPAAVWDDQHALPNLTWVTPLIILYPLIVPAPPRRALVASIAAAATRPLGLFLLALAGRIEVDGATYLSNSFSPALAVVLAYFGSRVVYGLGLEVARARRLGSYRLEALLGEGGMGEVWRARHGMLARPAAVKLIRRDLLGPGADPRRDAMLQRFEREAQATAALRSPHTVSLYDYGVAEDGTFYYVMELLDGFDAQTLVERFGPLPAARVIHLLRQVCDSLEEAHAARLIHRDIKPANIHVCRYGLHDDFVKVLDFGLVKTPSDPAERDPALTAENTVHGTPAFIAPELLTGKSQADPRSDIYAVGCVAYWMLTGHLVFEGKSAMEVLSHHIRTLARAPSESTEIAVPNCLDQIVLACLEKDPANRPQSARELSERLAACAGHDVWSADRAREWWELHTPDSGPEVPTPA